MKIKDIVQNVKKTKENRIVLSASELAKHVNLNEYDFEWKNQDRLVGYFLSTWYCTDSSVGIRVYFLDDQPVAISSQWGRKMGEDMEWLSKETYYKVKAYVESFRISKEEDDNIELSDPDQEIGESYKIEFNGQLYSFQWKIPKLNGESVEIIELVKEENSTANYVAQRVKIKNRDNKEEVVNIRQLDFPYYINENND